MANVQGRPCDTGAKGVSLGPALEEMFDLAALQAEAGIEGDAREEVRRRDADARGGGGQRTLGGADVRPAAKQVAGSPMLTSGGSAGIGAAGASSASRAAGCARSERPGDRWSA